MKIKVECCEKYARKGKLCKGCPLVAGLGKKKRRKWLERYRCQLEKAA